MKKRLFSVLKYWTAATLVVALVTGLVKTGFSPSKEAKAAGTSSTMGSDNYVTPIEVGKTYSFGGYNWIAAEAWGNYGVVLQSYGVTSGPWPGYKIWGNNSYYGYSIEGSDISSYDEKTQKLYNDIKCAEYGRSGLYLISNSKAGATRPADYGSGYYWQALKEAADNYSSFGAGYSGAWLGNVGYESNRAAWNVNSYGALFKDSYQGNSYVVAPAFDLNISKVTVRGNEIVPVPASTGIKATKSSIQSIEEGERIALSSVIGSVTYTGGTSNGKNASYTVSCDKGTINGTTYIAPRDVAVGDDTETFIITSTRNQEWTSSVQVKIAQKYVSVSYDVATNRGTSTAPSSVQNIDLDTVYDASSSVLTVGKDTVKKTGWTFVGWNTDRNAHTGLTSLKMDSDKTLYAIFKKDLTVTFIDAGS